MKLKEHKMHKSFFKILTSLLFILPIMLNAAFSGGTYYSYEFGNNDYYSTMVGGDGTYAMGSKVIFDGAGNFTSGTLVDSEGFLDPFAGTYTVENGVLTLQKGTESFSLRISPDAETLAYVRALDEHNEDVDNEVLLIMIKESDVKVNIVPAITYLLL